jgi:hypothetical protein
MKETKSIEQKILTVRNNLGYNFVSADPVKLPFQFTSVQFSLNLFYPVLVRSTSLSQASYQYFNPDIL